VKVRWTRSSVRLRITPTELAAICRADPITETLPVAGWSVQVVRTGGITELRSEGSALIFALSAADIARLAEPDREGIYFDQEVNGERMRGMIEKDFPCIHPHAMEALEVSTETFPEPPGFRTRKAE
jgi:hypothetical protein